MLIPTYYLLSKNWDIFATRCRILLIISKDYFRGGEIIQINNNRKRCNPSGYTSFFCSLLMIRLSQKLFSLAARTCFFVFTAGGVDPTIDSGRG